MDDATQDTDQLEQQLTVLLEQIESTTTNLVERISDDSPGLTYADLDKTEPPEETDPPEDAAGDTEAESEVRETEIHVPIEPAAPEQTVDETGADLESAVEEMLQQVVDESENASEKAEELDAELAQLGDELLAAEQEMPEGEVQPPAPEPAVDAEPTLDDPETAPRDGPAPPPADAAPEPEIEPVEQTAEPVDDEPPPGDIEAAIVEPITEPVASTSTDPTALPTVSRQALPKEPWPRALAIGRLAGAYAWVGAQRAWIFTRAKAPLVWAEVKPRLIQAMVLMSRPLDGKPPMVRSAIGWIAIVTAFWAMVVVIYVIAIRDPSPPTPEGPEMGPFETIFQQE